MGKTHTGLPCPFPWKRNDGSVVVDELCACGHMRSQHRDSPAWGHAECSGRGCPCCKFTWREFVFLPESHKNAP